MASRKRQRGKATSTHAVNTRGFAALADEIYLEILSYIPSVPIPTPEFHSESYPEIRRFRHETLLTLSQTSRSLRRFCWRYLWQRIEVREGMRIGKFHLKRPLCLGKSSDETEHKKYATELVRQLEIVTVRNPHLAQYVNYLDIFIGEYSIKSVLAELARCLTLFPNLHTVQIEASSIIRRSRTPNLATSFEQIFKKCSYPQIRNVFVMSFSEPFIASCPQARRVRFIPPWQTPISFLETMIINCRHLEVLDFAPSFWNRDHCKSIVKNFPNIRTIQVVISPIGLIYRYPSHMNIFSQLNHLQTIVTSWDLVVTRHYLSPEEKHTLIGEKKEDWIESLKRILIQIQLHDNLEKTIVLRDYKHGGDYEEEHILLKPKPQSALKEV